LAKRSTIGKITAPAEFQESVQRVPNKRLSGDNANKQIRSLLEQVVFCGVETAEFGGRGVLAMEELVVSPLKPGFSGSVVALVAPLVPGGLQGVPGVLKISRKEAADRELLNFQRYVKWYLPYRWRVDILGHGQTTDLGGICYSFVHGGGAKPSSVSEAMQSGREDVIDAVVNSILDLTSRDWSRRTRRPGFDMSEYFSSERFFKKKKGGTSGVVRERQERWLKGLREVLKPRKLIVERIDGRSVDIGGLQVPLPDALLSTNSWGDVVECVSHGDLNANNIIAELGSDNLALIDFYETGWWYVFRDFVSLELSVWLDMQKGVISEFQPLVEQIEFDLERFVIGGRAGSAGKPGVEPLPGVGRAVKKIRTAAAVNFPDTSAVPRISYALGLMVQAWLLGSWLNSPWEAWQKERLGAVVCAAARVASRGLPSP
jgi:hypothetical protein